MSLQLLCGKGESCEVLHALSYPPAAVGADRDPERDGRCEREGGNAREAGVEEMGIEKLGSAPPIRVKEMRTVSVKGIIQGSEILTVACII